MTDDVIPEDIRQFILLHIDSIAELEGLLMFRASPQKEWNAESISRGLFIDESQAALLLNRLAEKGFIATTASGLLPRYQYKPKSDEWANLMERLAELYKKYLVPVTNLIHAKPKSRVQKFADAFRIRKD